MILRYRTYLKILFIAIGVVGVMAIAYSYYFIRHYPIPITNRISFDAKITFIKEHISVSEVDTIIVGSSIGLNNVNGEVLEESSKKIKEALNLSVYESTPPQIEQVLELTPTFTNLKRVIYSAQYSDFAYAGRFKDYNSTFINSYLTDSLSTKERAIFYFKSCQNLFFCISRAWNWRDKYQQNNRFTYLGFDSSGSVPLHIYGDDIIPKRWSSPHSTRQNDHAFKALERIAKRLKKQNIEFIFVMQPYREPLVEKFPHVAPTMQKFAKRVEGIVSKYGGRFLNLHDRLHLKDKYFADRSHLNDKGSIVSSRAVGEFVDIKN